MAYLTADELRKHISLYQADLVEAEAEEKAKEQAKKAAIAMASLRDALMANSFTEEQAFRMILTIIEAGGRR